jgi:hypothetical protein
MLLTCKQVSDTASDLLEDPTTLTQRIKLRLHLMICIHCRRYLKQLRLAIGVVSNSGSAPAPSKEEFETLVSQLGDRDK